MKKFLTFILFFHLISFTNLESWIINQVFNYTNRQITLFFVNDSEPDSKNKIIVSPNSYMGGIFRPFPRQEEQFTNLVSINGETSLVPNYLLIIFGKEEDQDIQYYILCEGIREERDEQCQLSTFPTETPLGGTFFCRLHWNCKPQLLCNTNFPVDWSVSDEKIGNLIIFKYDEERIGFNVEWIEKNWRYYLRSVKRNHGGSL